MELDLIIELQTLARYQYDYTPEEFSTKAREIIIRAVNEILDLENIISEKETLIKKYGEEREDILHRLKKAMDESKKLREKLSDFDILRNMELLDMKREIENLRAERDHLQSEKDIEISSLTEKLNIITEERIRVEKELKELKERPRTNTYDAVLEEMLSESPKKSDLVASLNEAEGQIALLKEERQRLIEERDTLKTDLREAVSATDEERRRSQERIQELSRHKKEKEEEIDRIRLEMDSITTKLKNAEEEIVSLNEEKQKLIEERDGFLNKLKESEQAITILKDEKTAFEIRALRLEGDIAMFKANIESLKSRLSETDKASEEREAFSSRLQGIVGEVSSLIKEKDSEIASLKSVLDGANLRIGETLARLEHTIAENLSLAKRLEQIHSSYLPAVIQTPGKETPASRTSPKISMKWILVSLFLVLLTIAGGMVFYKFEGREKIIPRKETPKGSSIEVPVNKPWPESPRRFKQENFTVSVTFLSPQIIYNWGLPISLNDAAQNYYYLIEIKAEEGCIPEEFVISPSISFIDEKGSPIKMGEGVLKPQVIYKGDACNGERGAVLFWYFASLGKDKSPTGIEIKGLIGETQVIIK